MEIMHFHVLDLQKTTKKAPQVIAPEIKEKIKIDENIVSKIEVLGGYLNFFINKEILAQRSIRRNVRATRIWKVNN